jgi:hypothetical protein
MHIIKRKSCDIVLCNKGKETCLEGKTLLCELVVWMAELICFLYFVEVLKTALYTKLATCSVLAVDWKLTLKFTLAPWRVIYPATVFKYNFVFFIFSHFYWVLLSMLHLVLSLLLCLELGAFIFSLLSLLFLRVCSHLFLLLICYILCNISIYAVFCHYVCFILSLFHLSVFLPLSFFFSFRAFDSTLSPHHTAGSKLMLCPLQFMPHACSEKCSVFYTHMCWH